MHAHRNTHRQPHNTQYIPLVALLLVLPLQASANVMHCAYSCAYVRILCFVNFISLPSSLAQLSTTKRKTHPSCKILMLLHTHHWQQRHALSMKVNYGKHNKVAHQKRERAHKHALTTTQHAIQTPCCLVARPTTSSHYQRYALCLPLCICAYTMLCELYVIAFFSHTTLLAKQNPSCKILMLLHTHYWQQTHAVSSHHGNHRPTEKK